jgi:phage shock protein PspC (stress-responsive transcriptional regulator)
MAGRNEPLQRDVEQKKIAGVCAGFADYFDVDVTLVRAITAALILLGPAVVVLYAILWWALDEKPPAGTAPQAEEVVGTEQGVFAPPVATTDTPTVVDLSAPDKVDAPPGS